MESPSEFVKRVRKTFDDMVVVCNPRVAQEWWGLGVDVFLDSDLDVKDVICADRIVYIAYLLGEQEYFQADDGGDTMVSIG